MKKIAIITLTAILSMVSVAAKAQSSNIDEFSPYWYVQGQGGLEMPFSPGNRGDLLSPGFALNIGRIINPYFGARVGVEGFRNKIQKTADTYDKMKYFNINFDAMLNVSNLFTTNKNHPVNMFLLAGVGVDRSSEILTGSHFMSNARLGAILDARVSKAVSLSLEYHLNNSFDKWNGMTSKDQDWYSALYFGIAVNFGYKAKKAPVEEKVAEPVETPVPVPVAKKEVAPTPAPAPVKKLENMKENVFFTIGKYVAKGEEDAKITEAANWMKSHPSSVAVVTGYADKGTGSSAINKKLSEKRAVEVANKLKALGISVDRISVDSKGDTVQPFAENDKNRVVIIFAEEK